MGETTAQLRERYPWPAAMRRRTAAAYLDISEAAFIREVARGFLPQPVKLDGRDRWVKRELDLAVGNLPEGQGYTEADIQADWRWRAPLYEGYDPVELRRIVINSLEKRRCK